jgi:transcriptional regulator with XRE-family HTH domain
MGKKKKHQYKNEAFLKALAVHCRKTRVRKGYSQERMALESDNLSLSNIRRLERGDSDVRATVLLRYAEILEIPLPRLLDFQY